MANTTNNTYFVIKNSQGEFLEYLPYNGLRMWVRNFTDNCIFATQNEASLYCRSLIADAKNHNTELDIDVFKYNNTVSELDVTIPKEQYKMYGIKEENTIDNTQQ